MSTAAYWDIKNGEKNISLNKLFSIITLQIGAEFFNSFK
tara:strand:+ start:265 stop:381 length:117 start_codon:yes stop_codon:yes gene_type:complete